MTTLTTTRAQLTYTTDAFFQSKKFGSIIGQLNFKQKAKYDTQNMQPPTTQSTHENALPPSKPAVQKIAYTIRYEKLHFMCAKSGWVVTRNKKKQKK